MGEIEVATDRYWGAKLSVRFRTLKLAITMKRPLIRAFGILKKAAAIVNSELGLLSSEKCH